MVELKLDEFIPYFSRMTGHTQTLMGHLVPSPQVAIKFSEHLLQLPDGDELLIEYYDSASKFTLLLFHGLGGDSTSDYMRRSAQLAHRLGWNIVLVNHRGVGRAKARYSYHSGRGEDADAVIRWARHRFPASRQVAVGFSMSGSILLNLLTERYGSEQPDYAVVVNAPLDLAKSSELLSRGLSKIYDARFFLILKKMIIQRQDKLILPLIGKTRYIDEIFTSRVNGFKDAADYYRSCSALNYVDRIKTKTFVLSSYDDPFIDVQDYQHAKWSPAAQLLLQKSGGHMGYYSKYRSPQYGHRWLDHYLLSVFQQIEII